MATILITGATGFVGGALAANLLAAGFHVLALSRNDPDGNRTRESVRDAAAGFGLAFDGALNRRLSVLEVDGETLHAVLTPAILADVQAAWHAAAEMSYAGQKVLASHYTNVVVTARLYRLLAERAPACQRFFYVSTAYTSGMDGGLVREELHAGHGFNNVYQLTKSAAEHALSHLQGRHRLPVTIFRPTIVVGHSHTGWARRNAFGFHMFIEALASMGRAGVSRVHLNLNAAARPDLMPVDRLVGDGVALTARAAQGAALDIFHCAGGLGLRLDEVLRAIGKPSGVDVQFGALQTTADKRVDRAIEPNRRFASTEWEFCSQRLRQALGDSVRPAATVLELDRMVRWYLSDESPSTRRRRRSAAEPAMPASETLEAQAV